MRPGRYNPYRGVGFRYLSILTIRHARGALAPRPLQRLDRHLCLSNLAHHLATGYNRIGRLEYLENVFLLGQED